MARMPRLYLPGCAQHLVQRGNNKEVCFLTYADNKAYLAFLRKAAVQYRVAIHAFVLMSNHVHLLVSPKDEKGVGLMMQSLGRQYVRYFNQKYERTGTLWEGRYKSSLVDSERYLLMVYQYIELNPVRANMVRHASEYPWSSYQYNAVGRKIELITPHDECLALGVDDQERQANYRSLFRGKMKQVDLQAIREACQRASILGSEKFIKNFEEKTGRKAKSANRGGDRRSIKFRKLRFQ